MLNNININRKDSGFTIVELLVVIVVIGILAAITIVSYTGITSRANGTKALANARAIQTVAEIINADSGAVYPVTTAQFNSLPSTARIPDGIAISGTVDPIATTGTTNFRLYTSTTAGANKGGRIVFFDYAKNGLCTVAPDSCLYWGAAKATDTFAAFAS